MDLEYFRLKNETEIHVVSFVEFDGNKNLRVLELENNVKTLHILELKNIETLKNNGLIVKERL